ncbi:hypothetical protein ACB092_05G248200 [Castanea dentata]
MPNRNQVLSSLYSNTTIDYGFYYSSYGQNRDKVYTIGLCRGDVNPDDCRGCLKNSSTLLTQDCPNQKEAVGCSIFGIMDTSFHVLVCDMQNVSANYLAQFNDDVNILLNNLKSEAAAGASLRKYAAGSAITTDFTKIYALVQCTPDLSEQNCVNCLLSAIATVPNYCAGKVGRIVVLTSCSIRYDDHSFFDSTKAPSSTNTTTSLWNPSNKLRTVIIVVVASVAFVVLIVSICICVYLRESSPREKAAENVDDEIQSVESLQFDFSTISLGQGGFGVVYKGTLYNGQDVAVKRLSRNSGQGDLEFKNEVLLVAKLQHRNLVRLRISDFGMAKLFLLDQTQSNISRIVGTYGYMALEYTMHGYGQRNNCVRNGENVEDLLSYGNASHIIDPTLRHSSTIEIMRWIHVGLLCVQENVIDRPTMGLIVLMLNSDSITLPVPSQPAFFMHNNIELDVSSNSKHNLEVTRSNHSKGHYVQHSANEASITELYPR